MPYYTPKKNAVQYIFAYVSKILMVLQQKTALRIKPQSHKERIASSEKLKYSGAMKAEQRKKGLLQGVYFATGPLKFWAKFTTGIKMLWISRK